MDARRRALAFAVAAAALFACRQPQPGLTVFAAASTREVIEELAQSDPRIQINTAGTSILANQIRHAAPADIFVSADPAWVKQLHKENWLSRSDEVARNSMVLISATPPKTHDVKSVLLSAKIVAAADPAHVPAGRYLKASLQNLGIWDEVQPKLTSSPSVRSALALVASRAASVGVVYRTDVRYADVHVVGPLAHSDEDAPRVVAARLKSYNAAADGFYHQLTGAAGRAAFNKMGFE